MIKVLKCGKVPQHVAIIMDGNRRFATKIGLSDRRLGHYYGYQRFESVIDWCFQLGIKCVTVYAFSVENFKRTTEEVNTLMELAMQKLANLAEYNELIRRNKVAIRIIGELNLLPLNVRDSAIKAMKATAHHNQFILNICFPFVSKLEMARACTLYKEFLEDPLTHQYEEASVYRACLDTFDSPNIDILIRTSGERRLSEFMLHQLCVSPKCVYEFANSMWPEFSLFEFGAILLRYQNQCGEDGGHLDPVPQCLLDRRKKTLFAMASDNEAIGR